MKINSHAGRSLVWLNGAMCAQPTDSIRHGWSSGTAAALIFASRGGRSSLYLFQTNRHILFKTITKRTRLSWCNTQESLKPRWHLRMPHHSLINSTQAGRCWRSHILRIHPSFWWDPASHPFLDSACTVNCTGWLVKLLLLILSLSTHELEPWFKLSKWQRQSPFALCNISLPQEFTTPPQALCLAHELTAVLCRSKMKLEISHRRTQPQAKN